MIGGFIQGGSAGIGSITWGGLREPGTIKRLTLLAMEAEPQEIVLEEAETMQAFHADRTNGMLVELQLRLAPARRWDQCAVTGPDWAKGTAFAARLADDDALPKRRLSRLDASFGAGFKPLKKWLPEGHALIWLEVEEAQAAGIVAEAKAQVFFGFAGDPSP